MEYHCSHCGARAYYDGRCGDGPVLLCKCDESGEYVDEGSRGGYYTNSNNAKPVAGPGRTNRTEELLQKILEKLEK